MTPDLQQVTVSIEPGLVVRHRSLKDCVASGVYSRGIQAIAGKIDRAPSHLSEALSGSDRRKFDVDDLERYIKITGDTMPVLYLVAKYLGDPQAQQREALAKLASLADLLPGLLSAAGLGPANQGGRAR